MLKLIRENDCPKANAVKTAATPILNPFAAPGDPIQIKISAEAVTQISNKSDIPEGWKIFGDGKLSKGVNIVTLSIPNTTKPGDYKIRIHPELGGSVEGVVSVVNQVGKH